MEAGPLNYISAYQSGLKGDWIKNAWENQEGDMVVNFNAAAPGKTGNAIEVRHNGVEGFGAFGLVERQPGYVNIYKYLNEFKTVEFDIYFETDTPDPEQLYFILEDSSLSDQPRLVDLIPDWSLLSGAERYQRWFHITVDLAAIHPTIPRWCGFLLFNDSGGHPHYRLADIKTGWEQDLTPPAISLVGATNNLAYDQLTLKFNTDEAATHRVEFGIGNYSRAANGPADTWELSHTATLTGLTPGSAIQYRIIATGHRTDPLATNSKGIFLGAFTMPAAPVNPPAIQNLSVTNIAGNRAELRWTAERPATAAVTYQRAGGAALTRNVTDFAANGSLVLDLLEPSRNYTLTLAIRDAFALSSTQSISFATTAYGPPSVTITIDPARQHAISPWIYGFNDYGTTTDAPHNLTLNRSGGNRWTAYNWENNASNAGMDWGPYESDDYLTSFFDPSLSSDTPGEAARARIADDRSRNMASLITVQLQGYAAIDKDGTLIDINDPNSIAQHFKQVAFAKNAPFTATPSLNDPYVYMDEFLWAMRGKFPGDIYADPVTPTFVSLDNEPDIWFSTHAEIQKTQIGSDALIQKSIDLSKALKNVDPAVKIFGPAHYGFNGIQNLQGQPGFSQTYWFTDKYLADFKAASQSANQRLLDVYDIHWYSSARWPEAGAYDSVTSLTDSNLTQSQIQAIVQSPRSLWDPTYDENSWITRDFFQGPIKILPRLQAKIDAGWPGTRLAITEYENGGGGHIAGAIAQADNLGIFGSQNLFAATLWPLHDSYPFIKAGFKMFRDYDGAAGSFGDISLASASSAIAKVSAYASADSTNSGRYVIVAINRSFDAQDVAFNGLPFEGDARVFRLSGTNLQPQFVGQVPASLNQWIVTLPPLSVSTIELTAAAAPSLSATLTANPRAFQLTVKGTPGATYIILGSSDLAAWTAVQAITLPSTQAEVTFTPDASARFYRVTRAP